VGVDPIWVYGGPTVPTKVEFTVTVQNLGKEALTVFDVGLTQGRRIYEHDVSVRDLRGREGFDVADQTVETPLKVLGVDMPHTIPSGGLVEWRFSDSVTSSAGSDDGWHGFASQFRASGNHKITMSRRSVRRSKFTDMLTSAGMHGHGISGR
jgi:hypothetical protein